MALTPLVHGARQRHLTYPVLHYFHSAAFVPNGGWLTDERSTTTMPLQEQATDGGEADTTPDTDPTGRAVRSPGAGQDEPDPPASPADIDRDDGHGQ